MFTLQAKLIAGALLLALIGGLITVQHFTQKRLNAAKAELRTVHATLEAERDNTRKANESAQRHQRRADALETDRRDNPLPAVRVCKSARVPEARSATVTHEAPQADHTAEDAGDSHSVDIGPELDSFATDAESNLIQCEELQRWIVERSN
jgi:hypothetical protein